MLNLVKLEFSDDEVAKREFSDDEVLVFEFSDDKVAKPDFLINFQKASLYPHVVS